MKSQKNAQTAIFLKLEVLVEVIWCHFMRVQKTVFIGNGYKSILYLIAFNLQKSAMEIQFISECVYTVFIAGDPQE